ncbi:hypothetical protein [Rhodanobacter sp. DHG33]|nr:hypothetical protein [Rhodanobacter sp. DHG33]
MYTIPLIRNTMDRVAPLLLALFSSALIASVLVWSLCGLIHPLV